MGKNKQKKQAAGDATTAEEPPAKKQKLSGASGAVSEVPSAKAEEFTTLDARKIFVGGVPKSLEDSAVKARFAKLGEIEAFSFPRNGRGAAMGIAFITYKSAASAEKCIKLHGTNFEGQEISVKLQDDRPKSAKTKTPASGGESKAARRKRKKKEKKRLMLAGSKESRAKAESVKLEAKADAGGSKQKKKQRREEQKFNAKLEAAQVADEGKVKKKKKAKKAEA